MAAGCHSDGGHDNENELDTIETGPAVEVSQETEQKLPDDRAQESEEVDEQALPS